MAPKRGTPEYDLWRASPEYELWRGRNSAAHRGKRRSAEARAKQSVTIGGERHPNYGKHHSVITRAKIGVAQIGKRGHNYGKHFSAETRAKMRIAHIGKRHSAKTLAKMRGPNNSNWRGGISFLPYSVDWNNRLRETIRKRDNYACALCGKTQTMPRHDVHHINYEKEDLRPENLITLCIGCHRKTNFNREYWENLFKTVYVPNFPKERITKNESYC